MSQPLRKAPDSIVVVGKFLKIGTVSQLQGDGQIDGLGYKWGKVRKPQGHAFY